MFEKIIKIPNKSFDDLTADEVALMIEADSSLSPSGNECFSSCALDEFLSVNYLKRKDLQRLQNYISENIYLDGHDNAASINTEFLKGLVKDIKEGRFPIENS